MIHFDELWDYNQPEQTEQKFIGIAEQVKDNGNLGYIAELWTQIARAQGLQGRFETANASLDRVLSLLKEKELPRAHIRYLLERGRVFNSSGHPAQAVPLFEEAWLLARFHAEPDYAVDAAHMLGIAEADAAARMAWNLRALDYAEKHPEAERWLGSLYNNIGWAQVEAGQLEQAYAMFGRALAFREQQGNEELINIAKWCRAKVLRLMGRVAEALEIQISLYHDAMQHKGPSGYNCEEIAECLLAAGRRDESREYFRKAYELLSQDVWLAGHEAERLARIGELAQ
ncbi:hypothetical protein AWM70_05450 [Paenibacillus yonginensis]|uniref:MalT-like TPR region domain-containing protein n=1 Tax=Paenibacillus yonginensis TaxID=1462996 RepID=A0A1B1MY35_9BACL|nr:tetratricopeptide repeat protein [Paenibacillus yonginensis]ANS74088.1 hypothetical protein AWM70_05450 [Paenibacillus yonginensis]